MDIVSWTFGNQNYDDTLPLYIDAYNPSQFLTAATTRTLVRSLISGLQVSGLQSQDCVCVLSFNNIHYTALYLAIIGAGGCFTGANPGYTSRELSHHLRMTDAKYILTEVGTLQVAIEASRVVGIPRSKLIVLNYRDELLPEGYSGWTSLLCHGEKKWVEIEDQATPAAFVSTSGTSGLPKAAILPHSYLISQAQFQEARSSSNEQTSELIAVPPFHVFTIPVQHGLPLRVGLPCYIMPRFESNGFLEALEAFQITQTVTVPPIMMALSTAPTTRLRSLRRLYVGGSCATDGMQQQLYQKLSPGARIEQVFGMTEVGWATCWTREKIDRSGSVGQPLPGTLLRVVDNNGEPILTQGRTGNIQIHAPSPMLGYLNNPASTNETLLSGGWVASGDVGYVKDGNWYIVDRTKDLIKVRGWQVSPTEIEGVLLEHNDILDAGVIGVASDDGCGDFPMAFIEKTTGSKLSEGEVKDFVAQRLARYKAIHRVIFIDKIPRNPTGKILRRILRDWQVLLPTTEVQRAAEEYSNELRRLIAWQKTRKILRGRVAKEKRNPRAQLLRQCRLKKIICE